MLEDQGQVWGYSQKGCAETTAGSALLWLELS